RSRRWGPGGPSCLRTRPARRVRRAGGRARDLLRHARIVVLAHAVARPRVARVRPDPGRVRARLVRAAAAGEAAARPPDRRRCLCRRLGPAHVGRRGHPRELREARDDDVSRLVLPLALRRAQLGSPRRLHHPVGRRVLGLPRPDEGDHPAPRARVLLAVVRVPGARQQRRGEARPPRSPLLRALPRRGRALAAAGRLDVALPDRVDRRDDGARDLARRGRPTRAPLARARLPPAERGSALARRQGSSRHRSPSKSEVTQADPAAEATASGLCPTGKVRSTELVAGSTTETVLSSMFGTQRFPPTQVVASGLAPTVTVPSTAIVLGSTL